MNEIVKYHNDFNKIKLPSFTEQEQNLLCGIISKIRENPINQSIKLTPQELIKFSTENLTNKALGDMLYILRNKFFKADFMILIEDKERDLIGKEIINLFESFKLWYDKKDTEFKHLLEIELKVNPRFEYIVNEVTKNFTGFKLEEFIAISGKYTKTLYRLLKQFRSTGKAYFEWSEFLRIMDIPENKKICEIDRDILKPALKELTKERNIFDQIRTPFKNLAYEKEKQKGTRGRGGKVIGITFTFKPENIDMQILQHEAEKMQSDEIKYKTILTNMAQKYARFQYNNILHEFAGYDFENFKIITNQFIENEFGDKEKRQHAYTARNKELFFKMIDTFKNNIV